VQTHYWLHITNCAVAMQTLQLLITTIFYSRQHFLTSI